MNAKRLTLILLALLLASAAAATEQEGGIRLLLGSPTGEFGDIVDNEAFGIELTYGIKAAPRFVLGVGADVMLYGSEEREYELPLVDDFEVETDNNLADLFLYAQWRPLDGAVQPYVEGRAGLTYLWTASSLDDDDWFDEEIAEQTNHDDLTTFLGAGGGVMFRLSEGNKQEGKPGVLLDVKVMQTWGGVAEYLTEGDIEIVNDDPVFAVNESATDMLRYQLGVTLTF
ncbi:MAG TPA: outer membrane beta-barrel protein [Candidatus Krumholzibacteria bacterium]|nr:outer membrane beta-barrel protein [Candidatus Krumholzibacteria bacterium]HRX52135.1 outer membrane beta-barrel protein [Candidatus Krumholzibacteria bacterium]